MSKRGQPEKATEKVTIYALTERDGRVRYVGKTVNLKRRLSGHIRDAFRKSLPVNNWVAKRLLQGLGFDAKVLELCSLQNWQEREKHWIAFHRSSDFLLNVAEGGAAPFCSQKQRRENALLATQERSKTPLQKRVWEIKREIGQMNKKGILTDELKANLHLAAQKAPAIFGAWAFLK